MAPEAHSSATGPKLLPGHVQGRASRWAGGQAGRRGRAEAAPVRRCVPSPPACPALGRPGPQASQAGAYLGGPAHSPPWNGGSKDPPWPSGGSQSGGKHKTVCLVLGYSAFRCPDVFPEAQPLRPTPMLKLTTGGPQRPSALVATPAGVPCRCGDKSRRPPLALCVALCGPGGQKPRALQVRGGPALALLAH